MDKIKLIIFDLDGVLVEQQIHYEENEGWVKNMLLVGMNTYLHMMD